MIVKLVMWFKRGSLIEGLSIYGYGMCWLYQYEHMEIEDGRFDLELAGGESEIYYILTVLWCGKYRIE
jgi:hypothetical protein